MKSIGDNGKTLFFREFGSAAPTTDTPNLFFAPKSAPTLQFRTGATQSGFIGYSSAGSLNLEVGNDLTAGDLKFLTEGIYRWQVRNTGEFHPITTGAYDIGLSSFRVRTVYSTTTDFSDSVLFNSGAMPNVSQIRLQANAAGSLALLCYAANNSAISLDADWTGVWTARSSSAALIYKTAGTLDVFGNTGLTAGTAFTPTSRLSMDLANGNLVLTNPSAATSNTDHKISPFLYFRANIWNGTISEAKDCLIANAGISGQNGQYILRFQSTEAYMASFSKVGGLSVGQSAHTIYMPSGVINAETGFRVGSVAPFRHFLRGDGTNFVSSFIEGADIASALLTQSGARVTSDTNVAGSGAGLELLFTSSSGYVQSYDRSAAAWRDLYLRGSTVDIWAAGTAKLNVNSLGANLYGGTLYLGSGGSNLILFNNVAVSSPTFTNRSVGTKIVLWQALSTSSVDYAIGMGDATLWFSTTTSSSHFKWYGGTSLMMSLMGGSEGGSLVLGPVTATLPTNATNGFLYIRATSGVPTGDPTAFTGTVPMVYDITGNHFYIYNGGWKKVALT